MAKQAWVLLLLCASGCASMDRWASKNVEHREFQVRKVWVRTALDQPNEGYRKINRMTPVIAGKLLLTGNAIDGLVAWDRETGTEKWRVTVINGIEGGATLIRDRLFVGGSDGQFYSINAADGKIMWSVPTRAENLSEPLLDPNRGVLYLLNAMNTVYALEADSGKTLWVYNRQDANNFSIRGGTKPALRGDTLYVGFSDGFLGALNTRTGQIQWEIQLNRNKKFKDVDANPVIDGDRLYVAGFDDQLYCLSADKGDILWRHDAGGYAGLTVYNGKVFYPTSEGDVRALDRESGKLLWTIPVSNGIATSLVPYKGLLVFGESQGFVKFIDTNSGRVVSRFEPGRGVFSAPSVDEKASRLYFISNEANVYALEAGWALRSGFQWLQPKVN